MKKKGKQPVILTKLSSWDILQHRKDLGSPDPAEQFLKDNQLEQRFIKTFRG